MLRNILAGLALVFLAGCCCSRSTSCYRPSVVGYTPVQCCPTPCPTPCPVPCPPQAVVVPAPVTSAVIPPPPCPR